MRQGNKVELSKSATEPQGDPAAVKPRLPEIHFNIWEQEPGKSSKLRDRFRRSPVVGRVPESFLDIGLMIDMKDPMSEFLFILPWKVEKDQIEDLSSLIATTEGIPAVFNESWAVAKQGSHSVVYDPSGDKNFALVPLSIESYDNVCLDGYDAIAIDITKLQGSALRATSATNKEANRFYIRFRVRGVRRDFYAVGAHEYTSAWWSHSWQRTEDIDFRLNIRRGAPVGLENSVNARFVRFSKVHLFLMRSRQKDIIFHDKLFKTSRSLEDEEFWAKYSLAKGEDDHKPNLRTIKTSLGYQWKSVDSEVSEFSTLARFKVVEFGIGKFIAVAVLLGACGSMIWDAVKTSVVAIHSVTIAHSSAYVCATERDQLGGGADVPDARATSDNFGSREPGHPPSIGEKP